ncbi:hypothetical protein F5Y06DRAFT_293683 [Hypoxylon sp. FL0890]|nr:hypothetical protein F5Y06DRAFT_293683 [Hypoxylon sp. FL0890]
MSNVDLGDILSDLADVLSLPLRFFLFTLCVLFIFRNYGSVYDYTLHPLLLRLCLLNERSRILRTASLNMRATYSITKASVFLIGTVFSRIATGTIWAQFCDDTACSVNCGLAVSVNNPACLAREWGRNSIKLHGSDFIGAYLVHSPGLNCDCQNDCTAIPGMGTPTCMDISKNPPAKSYRFQLSTCKEIEGGPPIGNNCQTSSAPSL